MTRTRVLWLAKGLGRGGAEQLLATTAGLIDPRFELEVAYLLPWKDALVADITASGVPVHCLGQQHAADVRWAWRLRSMVHDKHYDIIHTHMPIPAVAARVALAAPRPRLVHTEHNVWGRYRLPTRWANALTYARNDHVLAVSKAVAESVDLQKVLGGATLRPVEVLHHGIRIRPGRAGSRDRDAARDKLGLPTQVPVVGTVANLTPKKDQRGLLDAFAKVVATVPDVRLVIVGTGPLEAELQGYARRHGLADRVLFTGMRDDVPDILPAFDVFALSSLFEGLSIAVVEALAAGVPTVVTDVGGLPEVVTDGVEGRLVPPSDPDRLASALTDVLTDRAVRARMSAAALARARDFDVRRALRRIEDVYDEVMGHR